MYSVQTRCLNVNIVVYGKPYSGVQPTAYICQSLKIYIVLNSIRKRQRWWGIPIGRK